MKHRIHIRRPRDPGGDGRRAAAAADAVLQAARARPAELTVVLTDSRQVRRLNARFAGDDRITDVLAFPAGPARSSSGRRYLGDVVIALPRARRQARQRGVPPDQEVALLTIHGILHLLGHDHRRAEARDRMWRLQSRALRRLGLDPQTLGVAL